MLSNGYIEYARKSKPGFLLLARSKIPQDGRGDVCRIGRQHFRDGVLSVRQQKTGATLAIPVHPQLQAVIDATPTTGLTMLLTRSGRTYSASVFSEQFRAWCDAAGLPQRCVFHGLRKAACRRLAELGCTAHEIAAISGHKSLREIERYTKAVDQAKVARAAMAKTAVVNGPPAALEDGAPVGVGSQVTRQSKHR
jgi:integrase